MFEGHVYRYASPRKRVTVLETSVPSLSLGRHAPPVVAASEPQGAAHEQRGQRDGEPHTAQKDGEDDERLDEREHVEQEESETHVKAARMDEQMLPAAVRTSRLSAGRTYRDR